MESRRVVLFDMDGTLVDTRQDIAAAANGARRELGLAPMELEDVVRAVGDGINAFVSRISFPSSDPRFEGAKNIFVRHYDAHTLGVSQPYPGIDSLLLRLHEQKDVMMAVVSNKPAALVNKLVSHFNWDRYFPVTLGGDSAPTPKPSRDLIDLAMAKLGFDSLSQWPKVWMVGDSLQDLDAAHSASVHGVWCSWGFMENTPERSHQFTTIRHPFELFNLLNAEHSHQEVPGV